MFGQKDPSANILDEHCMLLAGLRAANISLQTDSRGHLVQRWGGRQSFGVHGGESSEPIKKWVADDYRGKKEEGFDFLGGEDEEHEEEEEVVVYIVSDVNDGRRPRVVCDDIC